MIIDENEVIPWDGTQWMVESWNRDHNLRSGMENSVMWFYQKLARRIGRVRMQEYVDLVGYGNPGISGGDPFWQVGNPRISLEEQIDLLRRFHQGDLPFSEHTMNTVKDIIVLEESQEYRLSGKAGWATSVDPDVGWLVGYLEEGGNVYYFATNVERDRSVESLGMISRQITLEILIQIEIVD